MTTQPSSYSSMAVLTACLGVLTGCSAFGDKVYVITGTMVGIEFSPPASSANPGAAVTIGYDRAEMALVPTCDRQKTDGSTCKADKTHDAYSVLALFRLNSSWFGTSKIQQVVATGEAAKQILEQAAQRKAPEPKKMQSVEP